jgi:hypothetical protein
MWKRHFIYESRPCSVVSEAVPTTAVSLISAKQCKKVVSQTDRFVLFMVWLEGERKVTATEKTSARGLST